MWTPKVWIPKRALPARSMVMGPEGREMPRIGYSSSRQPRRTLKASVRRAVERREERAEVSVVVVE